MNSFYFSIATLLLVLTGCGSRVSNEEAALNQRAKLKGELKMNPLEWSVITCGTDPNTSTMSTLFGNEIAVQYARRYVEGNFPAGSMLSLVTWSQQDDTRWFGAKMPSETRSVEFVTVGTSQNGQISYQYQRYESSPLKEVAVVDSQASLRVAYLLSQRAAVMP